MSTSSSESKSPDINYHASVCHWMPCSIDYDGVAPVSMYFIPEAISMNDPNGGDDGAPVQEPKTEQQQQQRQERVEGKETNKRKRIHAVAFRGRGLLATEIQKLHPANIRGVVYLPPPAPSSSLPLPSTDNHQDDDVPLSIGETFTQVIEWDHESDIKKKRLSTEGGNMARSLYLMELLQRVHEPIDVTRTQCHQDK
jgi:Ribonuclease H2 non-catalytic subunit (Ylr154p-like).